jgi:sulfur-oxidizing protein SoxX
MRRASAVVGVLALSGLGGAMAADSLAAPAGIRPGDAARGAEIAADRRLGLCTLCHRAPLGDPHLHGELGPALHGIGARMDAGQLRLRVTDPRRLNPDSVMPAYGRTTGLVRVAARHAGQPLLEPQQIEDVVAWLQTLR